eukprot:GHVU01200114.1.p1 GENE.GHVU01200114.1~~GHVU01200114.1.p1  ORF type:complete len:867 (+),score=52.69 GHVU01200114.1:992-3592(+)
MGDHHSLSGRDHTDCRRSCRAKTLPYAAIRRKTECYCGHHLPPGGILNADRCTTPCNDDSKCGGKLAASVYMTEPIWHFGCWQDHPNDRVFSHVKNFIKTDRPYTCLAYCNEKGYRFAGLQRPYRCYCGNGDYMKWGRASSCDFQCSDGQPCGGHGANDIYATLLYNSSIVPAPIGCWKDSSSNRVLEKNETRGDTNSSPFRCYHYCKEGGYAFAAMQSGSQCFCGWEFTREGTSGAVCDKPCQDGYNCGGSNSNSVFALFKPKHMGCWLDDGNRTMTDPQVADGQTPYTCSSYCLARGYKYAAMQNGRHCFCSATQTAYQQLGQANETECTSTCSDNSKCGGSYRNDVYEFPQIPVSKFKYLGCWGDAAHRVMPEYPVHGQNESYMGDIRGCLSNCKDLGYMYASLQSGWCLCGIDYTRMSWVDGCASRCQGAHCGGHRNQSSVYLLDPSYKPEYLGCYEDDSNDPVMWHRLDTREIGMPTTYNSVHHCVARCQGMGYRHAGLQAGYACFCGPQFARKGKKPDSECNSFVNGENFGGDSRTAVYRTPPIRTGVMIGCFRENAKRESLWEKETFLGFPGSDKSIDWCIHHCDLFGLEYRWTYATVMQFKDGRHICECARQIPGAFQFGSETSEPNTCGHRECGGRPCGTKNFRAVYTTRSWHKAMESDEKLGGHHIGCYQDSTSARMMPKSQSTESTGADPKGCISACTASKFQFAGITNKNECWCGDFPHSQFRKSQPDDTLCNTPCDDGSHCGGENHLMSVYKLPQKYEAMGCFKDSSSDRDLPTSKGSIASASAWACVDECETWGFKYAGIQDTSECWCGNSFGKHGRGWDNHCDKLTGDKTSGGGSGYNTVYRTLHGRVPLS